MYPSAWATRRRAFGSVVALALALAALTAADSWLFGYDAATKLDLRFGYGRGEVMDLFHSYGRGGRQAYGANLAIDSLYPLVLAAAVVLVSERALPGMRRWPWIAPSSFAVLDVVENALLGISLLRFPDVPALLIAIASPITRLKLIAFLPTVALGLAAVGVLGYRTMTRILTRRRAGR